MNWQENNKIVEQMIKGSTGELWGVRLEQADHYKILKSTLDLAGHSGTLLDIGCGAGDVSRSWRGEYIGVDLSWVIKRVSSVCNPSNQYLESVITPDSVSTLPVTQVALLNAFLDANENPHDLFEAVLRHGYDRVIVHRQKIAKIPDVVEYGESYGGAMIPVSVMSLERITATIKRHDYCDMSLIHWSDDYHTFTVRKK
jgi:hypothetical protein